VGHPLRNGNRLTREIHASRVEGLGHERLLSHEQEVAVLIGFDGRHINSFPLRRGDPQGVLLFRFRVQRTGENAAVFPIGRGAQVDKMPPVRQKGRKRVPILLARRVQPGERAGGASVGRHLPEAAARLAENDDALPAPCAAQERSRDIAEGLWRSP
jgi:hypothetical protein